MPGGAQHALIPDRAADRPQGHPIDLLPPLGRRDEIARQDQPALGMLPADQRLNARHRLTTRVDLRLVHQYHFVPIECTIDFLGKLNAGFPRIVERVSHRRDALTRFGERGLGLLGQ